MEWIKVEDELPINNKNVITFLNGRLQIMCYCEMDKNEYAWCTVYDGLDGDAYFDDNYYPTHWMPLPEPPLTNK